MQHYDVFSVIYEYGTEKLHGGHRRTALDLLKASEGDTVLDVPTGTGANLPLLADVLGPTGHLYAVDYSPGMLAKAKAKVDTAGWSNVTLIEADARDLSSDLLGRADGDGVDAAICMLGLSVIPDWEAVFERMYSLVRPGGRIVIMDLYLQGKRSSALACRYYKTIAQADQRRRFWEPLQARGEEFQIIDHDWFGGVARIVAATKPIEIDLRDPAPTTPAVADSTNDQQAADITPG